MSETATSQRGGSLTRISNFGIGLRMARERFAGRMAWRRTFRPIPEPATFNAADPWLFPWNY